MVFPSGASVVTYLILQQRVVVVVLPNKFGPLLYQLSKKEVLWHDRSRSSRLAVRK